MIHRDIYTCCSELRSTFFSDSDISYSVPIDDKHESVAIDNIALAEKDLGLILVGTFVFDDSDLRQDIIDNRRTKHQEAYREGEIIGQVQTRKFFKLK